MNEDCLLVEAIKAGHTDRFEELVERYKDKVYNMACRIAGSPQEGQDLAQEIFLLIYKNLNGFKGQSTLSTWIYRITLNRCLDWQRQQQRRNRRIFPVLFKNNEEVYDPMENVASNQLGPEEELLVHEQHRELHLAIRSLPEKYQKVIVLYHFQQMSYQEISEVLELPTRTVETHLYRAKQKLRQLLTEYAEKGVSSYEYVRS